MSHGKQAARELEAYAELVEEERASMRRSTMLSPRFRSTDVAVWERAVKRSGIRGLTLTQWVEFHLNKAAESDLQAKTSGRKCAHDFVEDKEGDLPRKTLLSRRYRESDVEVWREAAEWCGVSMARWMEHHLNEAAE